MYNDVYIVDGVRTAIGNLRGGLSAVRADDLAAIPLKALVDKNPTIPIDKIDDVIMGCANQAGEDNRNVARMALLLAGLPQTVPGETVNRLCASGMSAIIHAVRGIAAGDGDLYFSGGVEHMTRAPFVIGKSDKPFGSDNQMYDTSFGWRFVNPKMKANYGVDAMGQTAENLAEKYSIGRREQDEFALWSQTKAKAAQDSGRLGKEITDVLIQLPKKEAIVFNRDEFIKGSTNLEVLDSLRPAFRENGSVTAGNASGLNDGAAAVAMASKKAVQDYNLQPIAKIISSAVVGVEPRIMGIGPVEASRKALAKAGLRLEDVGVIEINEAFAVQVLACMKELGLDYFDPRVNINGGAIALGHPLGMSGARIVYSAALELRNSGKQYGLATMCIGVGQGYAVVLENVV